MKYEKLLHILIFRCIIYQKKQKMSEPSPNQNLVKLKPHVTEVGKKSSISLTEDERKEENQAKIRGILEKAKQKEAEAVARAAEISTMIPNCNEHSQAIYNKFENDKTFTHLLQAAALKISEKDNTNNQGGQVITAKIIDEVLQNLTPEDEAMQMYIKLILIVKPKATKDIKDIKETELESIRNTFSELSQNILTKLKIIDEYKDVETGANVIDAAKFAIDFDRATIEKIVRENSVLFNNINFANLIFNVYNGSIEKALKHVEKILQDNLNNQINTKNKVDNSNS